GKAYGTLFDNSYRSYYHLADERDDRYYFYADGGPLTYYVFEGPEIENVLNRYTDLTGKMPLPPEWSLGFQQSSWSYFQKDAEEVAQTYRDKRIPADGVFFDIEWMNNYRAFEWGKNVPDPVGLNKKLDQLHFK